MKQGFIFQQVFKSSPLSKSDLQHNKHVKVIIVGAHGEARQLINRISTGWNISVIDMDQEKLRNFNPNRQIEKYQGDGTSTLVLKKAGIENASALVTLTCLLYTSPSPRDTLLSRMPSSA